MKPLHLFALSFMLVLFAACTHPPTNYAGEYPDNVRLIMENKCATAGCHNDKSYINAANLQLDRWDNLWKGSGTGSAVIPYDILNTPLLYFINNDSAQGPIIRPQMPLNAPALSASEYATIRAWIAAGAPDKAGNVAFASDPANRQKIYITQQGCDLIAVVDASTGLIMRYISIGTDPSNVEIAHCVRFAPDGKYAYVSFTKGKSVQKIDVETDKVVGSILLGDGAWNLLHISHDGTKMLVTDLVVGGEIKLVDLEKMAVIETYYDFQMPHGIASSVGFDTFWVTGQSGNVIYRFNLKGVVKQITLDGKDATFSSSYDPHEIMMSPDRSKYFVSCQTSNEVRVMDAKADTLIKAIHVGTFPQEFALSTSKPYIFVSCQEDATPEYPTFKGSVYVINYNTLEIVKRIPGPFYQIHGIAVDDRNGRFCIVSRNVSTTGPAPHHTSECGGRNGYYNIYDLNTFAPYTNTRFESTSDPYSADVRFK